ncbi:MAG: GNAT family N-acetyltransferase [Oscillospiraceae bacterium]|nr:GNAT family N-acetyltransferase [Oscillospiraceae bacterium]
MNKWTLKYNELTAAEFTELWETVWGDAPNYEQIELAMSNTLFRISVYDGEQLIAMSRMIGDKGLCYNIKDVVVRPEYQGKGVGRMMIQELLRFVGENGIPNTEIFVELCAMPDKIPFYEKFGFAANEAQRLKIMYPVRELLK